jgi:hypothetical protein
MRSKPSQITRGRRGERGAALITSLLVSMLLLAAGGALIATAGMSVSNAVDATAEAQAYYAAEAGLHAAVSVLRGNVAKRAAMALPNGTKIRNDLRVANQLSTSNLAADAAPQARLSGWLPYNGTGVGARVPLDAGGLTAFSLALEDPDDKDRSKLTAAGSTYVPRTLIITSLGHGPKGAVKRMQLLYRRTGFEFDPPSTLLMAGNVTHFAVGASRKKGYSGNDEADAAAPPLPVFGFTAGGSQTYADTEAFDCAKEICEKARDGTTDPQTATIPGGDLPAWLRNPQEAAAFLDDLEAQARGQGRYFATKSGAAVSGGLGTPSDPTNGTPSDPRFTFVDGNYSVSGNGAGLLVVTGNLELKGDFEFEGIVLVLGSYKDGSGNLVGGHLDRNGGGGGTIAGALVVAKFDRQDPDAFLDTWFDTDGGGTCDILYDSHKVSEALGSMGGRLLGIVEN